MVLLQLMRLRADYPVIFEPWSVVVVYDLGACWFLDNPYAACRPCMWMEVHGF